MEKQNTVKALGHSFGTWRPSAKNQHTAACSRCGIEITAGCKLITVPITADTAIKFCPICGYREEMENLSEAQDVKADVEALDGNPAVFVMGESEENKLISIAFENEGKTLQPKGQVNVSMPAAMITGYGLYLVDQNGKETAVETTVSGDQVTCVLNFSNTGTPVLILKLIPQN